RKSPVRKKRTKKAEEPQPGAEPVSEAPVPAPAAKDEPAQTMTTEDGTILVKKRKRKAPMKRAPAKPTAGDNGADAGATPVVKKGRSLFGSRRSKG
ncbi:MAG: hypothetical protein AAGH64_13040, partial [Planctomycetota bacterium]